MTHSVFFGGYKPPLCCLRLLYQKWRPRGPESVAHVEIHWDFYYESQFLVLLDCSESFLDIVFALFTKQPTGKVEPPRDIGVFESKELKTHCMRHCIFYVMIFT